MTTRQFSIMIAFGNNRDGTSRIASWAEEKTLLGVECLQWYPSCSSSSSSVMISRSSKTVKRSESEIELSHSFSVKLCFCSSSSSDKSFQTMKRKNSFNSSATSAESLESSWKRTFNGKSESWGEVLLKKHPTVEIFRVVGLMRFWLPVLNLSTMLPATKKSLCAPSQLQDLLTLWMGFLGFRVYHQRYHRILCPEILETQCQKSPVWLDWFQTKP